VRYYRVSCDGGAPLVVHLKGTGWASYYSLDVHRGSVTGPCCAVTYQDGHEIAAEVPVPEPGDHYIEVRSRRTEEMAFSLLADIRPACPVTAGEHVLDAHLRIRGDVRYYRISSDGLEPLVVQLKGADWASHYSLDVRRGSVTGACCEVTHQDGHEMTAEVPVPDPGDYYIEVRNRRTEERTFSLLTDFRPSLSVTAGDSVSDAHLRIRGDVRYYRISSDGLEPLVVQLKGADWASHYSLDVHCGSVTGPCREVTYQNGYQMTAEVPVPEPGDYYVEVRNRRTEERTFSLHFEGIMPPPRIAGVSLSGDWVHLVYNDLVAGARYEVECCRDLKSGTWAPAEGLVSAFPTVVRPVTVRARGQQEFYRLRRVE